MIEAILRNTFCISKLISNYFVEAIQVVSRVSHTWISCVIRYQLYSDELSDKFSVILVFR